MLVGFTIVVDMVLVVQDGFKLLNGGVEMNPSPALGRVDPINWDARLHQPILDSLDSLARRGKELDAFFLGVVLAILWRIRIRAAIDN